ncbi:hypothetical protein [Rubrobacter tropicus]|uniref:hypothetical protein n=1 Tax=Rubrobacter tropicus TaxID=2653851 RepID=UPI00140E7677|nr:hypothetical protein [Rubrobacter tropicus]
MRDGGGDQLEGARVTGVARLLALSLTAFGAFGLWAGCSALLFSTPLVGSVAELTGLRVALGLVVLAGFAVFILSLRLRENDTGQAG